MEQVLIVTPFFRPNIGGGEVFADDLAKALSKKYIVHICTIKWTKSILWEGMNFKKGFILAWKLFFSLWKMKRKYHYEKVYALGLIPSFLCVLLNIKFSAIMLALYDFKRPNWFKFILNKAQKIFVEGNKGKEDMLNLGIKEEKIVKFHHWCDQTRFYYTTKCNERFEVLFVGRPIRIKGKHIIQECEKLTKGVNYGFIENVPYETLPKYYQDATVVVVPSLYSEGFSKVVIEAASCGCAVIASNKGALPEMVNPFGKVIEPTPENFANEITKLQNNIDGLEKIQYNTALYALNNFSEKNAEVFY